MNEQGSETVNPGQAIYDALSDEAKAAVDALPNDAIVGESAQRVAGFITSSAQATNEQHSALWSIQVSDSEDSIALNVAGLNAVYKRRNIARILVRADPQDAIDLEPIQATVASDQVYSEQAHIQLEFDINNLTEPVLSVLKQFHFHAVSDLVRLGYKINHRWKWHRDDWRVKLDMLTGAGIPAPSYVPPDRIGLPMEQNATPGEAIYDALSDEAKAAVDALPDDLFIDVQGVDCAAVFCRSIAVAQEHGQRSWSIFRDGRFIALNVGRSNLLTLNEHLLMVVNPDLLGPQASGELEFRRTWNNTDGSLVQFRVDETMSTELRHALEQAHLKTVEQLARPNWNKTERAKHYDDVRVRLATLTGEDVPAPGYLRLLRYGLPHEARTDLGTAGVSLESLRHQFSVVGMTYTDSQIASFYTAMQTKGFVILSGISGTGKSKIAQRLAELLPSRRFEHQILGRSTSRNPPSQQGSQQSETLSHPDIEGEALQPLRTIDREVFDYMRDSEGFMVPRHHFRGLAIPEVGERWEISVRLDDEVDSGWLITESKADGARVTSLKLSSALLPAFKSLIAGRDRFSVELFGSSAGEIRLVRIAAKPSSVSIASGPSVREADGTQLEAGTSTHIGPPSEHDGGHTTYEMAAVETRLSSLDSHLFLPVRPDWRDGKALIGYHNPLTGEYVRTGFLDFVIAAAEDYRAGNRNAFFVILDEMNLAHVEYYFADVLSVIESGRDAEGWTVEGIPLAVGEEDADLPEVLRLPPNLYIVGTVNMDETTHPFSPKVLDRAFTIELTEVDFSDYPPGDVAGDSDVPDGERQALLEAFTRHGQYPRIDKDDIRAVVERHPGFRAGLDTLNRSLQRYRMHFGYRVFDEIMQFVHKAEANKLFASPDDAFDHAVLMKVLPKFTGSRAKLENALYELIHWCRTDGTITAANRAELEAKLAQLTEQRQPLSAIVVTGSESPDDDWRYPATGRRAALMMQDLYTDGFAAFG